MRRYAYKYLRVDKGYGNNRPEAVEKSLNQLGSEGWRVVPGVARFWSDCTDILLERVGDGDGAPYRDREGYRDRDG